MVPYADLNGLPEPDGILVASFFQNLGHHHVRRATGGLSDFHDLYAETLVGEGDYDHDGINTPLVEAVDAPTGAGEAEKTGFAALLLDRLAFVRLMRDRGVLEIKLHKQWSHHNKGLNRFQGSFYDTTSNPCSTMFCRCRRATAKGMSLEVLHISLVVYSSRCLTTRTGTTSETT